jgi:Zn(2)-Cys(6) binuclear cluster domain-containing protein
MSSFSRRPLLPKPPTDDAPRDGGQHGPPPLPPPPPHKREMVRVACQACRARKIKCDARRPICSPCTTRNRSCEYETEADVDRYTSLKRRHIRLEKDHSELMELFEMIKVRPTRDAHSILNRVGSTQDLGDTLSFVKQGDLLFQTAEESQSPVSPDSSPAVSLLTSLHPLAYPALGPLGDYEAGLGERRLTLMQAQPGRHGNNLTQDDIDATR